MSSYFDEMTRRAHQALEENDIERAKAIALQAGQRVKDYLDYLAQRCLATERPKVNVAIKAFEELRQKKIADIYFFIGGDLHELGHNIGRARIRLKGGGWASDNPYYPGHWEFD